MQLLQSLRDIHRKLLLGLFDQPSVKGLFCISHPASPVRAPVRVAGPVTGSNVWNMECEPRTHEGVVAIAFVVCSACVLLEH